MDQNDEKFFEQLSGAASDADKHYEEASIAERTASETEPEVEIQAEAQPSAEAELARASTGVLSSAKPRLKTKRSDAEWADGEPEGQLTVDVYQTPTEIVVESAIAGVRADDLDITVTSDSISIRGTRAREQRVREEDYLYQECYWGKFARSLILPQEVDPESAAVVFKNGILTVTLPKANKKKTRKLHVRVD